jgi:hypothetical protein
VVTQSLKPFWLSKMYPGKPGRDHLGLGSVSSDQILPTLAPSINVLTFHPRYHSFYVFLLDEFWRRERSKNYSSWVAFYRPREFVFSVGCYLCEKPEHQELKNIVGGQKTSSLAGKRFEKYSTDYHYIDSNLGGYGLYYRTAMADLGLIFPGGRGLPYPVDVPSKPLGMEVAESFRQAVQDTEYYNKYFLDDLTEVPIQVIQEYIHKACLCQLKTTGAPDRKILQNLFLSGGNQEAAKYRSNTLRFFLDIAKKTDGSELEENDFRQLIYLNHSKKGMSYIPQQDLILTFKRWRLYQAREYYSFAINALWFYITYWGLKNNGDRISLTISGFMRHIEKYLDFEAVTTHLNIKKGDINSNSSLDSFLNWIEGLGFEKFALSSINGDTSFNEHDLYELSNSNRTDPGYMVSSMVMLLAIIFMRVSDTDLWQQDEWQIAKMGSDGRLSMDGFVRSITRMRKSGPITLLETMEWLINKYVIIQHQMVASSKLPDNTFRFRRDGSQLKFFNLENTLAFMNSRFDSISTTVHELGFCGNLHSPDHSLSTDGKAFLENGEIL